MMHAAARGLAGAWRGYEKELQRHPVRTQMLTTAALWTVGDVAAQRMQGRKTIDFARSARAAAYAGLFVGPVGHFWYLGLDKAVAKFCAPGTVSNITSKVVLDTFVYGPVHVAAYFGYTEMVEGRGIAGVSKKLKDDFAMTFVAELGIWPAFQAFNFCRIPVEHQLLAVNLMCLVDSTFLCWVTHEERWFDKLMARLGIQMPSSGKDT